VPGRSVALGASVRITPTTMFCGNRTCHVTMAMKTVILQNRQIAFCNPNRLWKILSSKCPRVVPAIFHFYEIFKRKRMRNVAVITGRRFVMTRFYPRIIFVIHDVTIDAGLRIITQVGSALCINESKDSSAY
jgi:hypothetical protein